MRKIKIVLKKELKYDPDIQKLIDDLYQPGYITTVFSDLGIETLVILSHVFRVDKSYLGNYLAKVLYKNWDLYKSKRVLDMGCGCGLLGLVCAKGDAKLVHFSDINSIAIKNSRINSILLDLENVSFSCGDLFNHLPSNMKFDLIIFNPPNISGTPHDSTQPALIREDKVILDFYKNFHRYLKKGGILIMPGSSRFDIEMSPINMVKSLNLKFEIIDREQENDGNYKYIIGINNTFLCL